MSSIVCPHCQSSISLTDALSQDVLKERLSEERAKIAKSVTLEVRSQVEAELADQKERAKNDALRIKELSDVEKAMRMKLREMESKARDAELEAARKFDEERRRIEQEAGKRGASEMQLKLEERELQINGLRRQIEELSRKVDQGSQQAQGEVFELAVERTLAEMFPSDEIAPVTTGTRGADVIQTVVTPSGSPAGRISWEVKRTKHWKNEWLSKAKADCLAAGADVAVIISQAMPADVESLQLIDGVYVVNFASWRLLATILRKGVMDIREAKLAQAGRETKATQVYAYVTGRRFKQQLEAIIRAYASLSEQLEKERRALNKCWAEREKIIELAAVTTACVAGEIQAIAGEDVQDIEGVGLEMLQG